MKKLLLFLLLLSVIKANAQLDKGFWINGGSFSFYSYESNYTSYSLSSQNKYTRIQANAKIGYLVLDKLACGIQPTYDTYKGKNTSTGSTTTTGEKFWIGPFVRYYMLDKEKPYNVITEGVYQFGFGNIGGSKMNLKNYSILMGPVLFLNSCVGIELLIGYRYTLEDIKGWGLTDETKGFYTTIGFQIHLEKIKK